MTGPNLDKTQAAAADQFNRQSDRYGKSHILAETSDVEAALQHIVPTQDAAALDVATGATGIAAMFFHQLPHGQRLGGGGDLVGEAHEDLDARRGQVEVGG